LIPPVLTALRKNKAGDPGMLVKGCRALENTAYGSDKVREYMKAEGTEAGVTELKISQPGRDDVARAVQAVIDALNRKTMQSSAFVVLKPRDVEKKKVRDIFEDNKRGKVTELKQEVKNFLTAGQLLMKHSKSAQPRSRHVYVTDDLKYLIWKDPKEKALHPDNKMKIFKIRSLERGRATKQLQRKNLMGKILCKRRMRFRNSWT